MNKNLFQDLKFRVFQSGDPSLLYIGINVIVFVVIALINVPFLLAGNGIDFGGAVNDFAAFPSAVEKMPFRFYTLITYQFFHAGLFHLLFNVLWLHWMGRIFLDFLQPRQFHFVYLAGGIAGALVFAIAFNIFPVFKNSVAEATLIGSSASVMAIVVAAATLVPDYTLKLLLFGYVKLKYLALAYIVLNLIGTVNSNAGGNFAHLGGAILGFTYVKMLKVGRDWSHIFNVFKKKSKLRVVKNDSFKQSAQKSGPVVDQTEIDRILDKISKSGYDNLSREEKEILFKASKH